MNFHASQIFMYSLTFKFLKITFFAYYRNYRTLLLFLDKLKQKASFELIICNEISIYLVFQKCLFIIFIKFTTYALNIINEIIC